MILKLFRQHAESANVTEKRHGKQGVCTPGSACIQHYGGHQNGLFTNSGPSIVAGMRFAQDSFAGNSITAYARGQITVNEQVIVSSVIVTPERIILDWLPDSFAGLEEHHMTRLADLEPEIIVLGTGATARFSPPAYTARFLTQGIGVETMDTAAACRTFNILMSEERRVVAALLMA